MRNHGVPVVMVIIAAGTDERRRLSHRAPYIVTDSQLVTVMMNCSLTECGIHSVLPTCCVYNQQNLPSRHDMKRCWAHQFPPFHACHPATLCPSTITSNHGCLADMQFRHMQAGANICNTVAPRRLIQYILLKKMMVRLLTFAPSCHNDGERQREAAQMLNEVLCPCKRQSLCNGVLNKHKIWPHHPTLSTVGSQCREVIRGTVSKPIPADSDSRPR